MYYNIAINIALLISFMYGAIMYKGLDDRITLLEECFEVDDTITDTERDADFEAILNDIRMLESSFETYKEKLFKLPKEEQPPYGREVSLAYTNLQQARLWLEEADAYN